MLLKLLNVLISIPFSNIWIGLKLTRKGGNCGQCGALQLGGHPPLDVTPVVLG